MVSNNSVSRGCSAHCAPHFYYSGTAWTSVSKFGGRLENTFVSTYKSRIRHAIEKNQNHSKRLNSQAHSNLNGGASAADGGTATFSSSYIMPQDYANRCWMERTSFKWSSSHCPAQSSLCQSSRIALTDSNSRPESESVKCYRLRLRIQLQVKTTGSGRLRLRVWLWLRLFSAFKMSLNKWLMWVGVGIGVVKMW